MGKRLGWAHALLLGSASLSLSCGGEDREIDADAHDASPAQDGSSERDAEEVPDQREAGQPDAATVSDAAASADTGPSRSDAGVSDAAVGAPADAGKDATPPANDGGAPTTFPTNRADFGLGGPSQCSGGDFLLCEGFEADAIDTKTWELQSWGKGSASIDSSRAARGKHSLHVTQPSEAARVVLRETKTFAQTGNHFFGRVFLFMTYLAPALECDNKGNCPNLVHWTAVSAGGTYVEGGKTYQPEVRSVGAVNQVLLTNLEGAPKGEVGIDDHNAPAGYAKLDGSRVGQWMCFEFEYAGEGANAEVRVYWDGLEHPGLHYSTAQRGSTTELWPIPKYEYLDIGLAHYQNYGAYVSSFDAWLDELVVDDQRVGCGR